MRIVKTQKEKLLRHKEILLGDIENANQMVLMLEESSKWEKHPANGNPISDEDKKTNKKLLKGWKNHLKELQKKI